jgi:hypothetical protein
LLHDQAREAAEAMAAELSAAASGVAGEALPDIAAFGDFAKRSRRHAR